MKIFCIGFQKTGTSSMGAALRKLGYSVVGGKGSDDPQISETAIELVDRLVPEFDAFQDNPWTLMYRELDEKFPGSKFILTTRNPESWLRSVVIHFGNSTSPMREWIYGQGDPIGHEELFLERYKRHNAEVLDYFAGREGKDLLVMSLERGDGWPELCTFLGLPVVSDSPFPHRNSASKRNLTRTKLEKFWRKIRRRMIEPGTYLKAKRKRMVRNAGAENRRDNQ